MTSSRDRMNSREIADSAPKAIIFNIQRYCLHDGLGIRTTVFFKGCQLRCIWCCNPESFDPRIEIQFSESKCLFCGKCLTACPKRAINPDLKNMGGYKIDGSVCDLCGKCIEVCPSGALHWVGKAMSVEEVYKEIMADLPFFRSSGGGVTFSGGEPLLQIDFLQAIMKKCYRGKINTAIETCGYVPWENFKRILKWTNYVLYDIKHMDSKKHEKLTGVPNELILENAQKLAKAKTAVIIRVPLIPGYNDDEKNMKELGKFVKSLPVKEVHLLPYHRLGKEKYKLAHCTYKLEDLQDMATTETGRALIKKSSSILKSYGLKVFIGG